MSSLATNNTAVRWSLGSTASTRPSANDGLHWGGRLDAGEALVQTLIFVGELLVVNTKQVQNGRLEITHMNGIFHDVVAEFVGLAVDDAALDPPAGHPEAE